jgi:ABC-2 type transport system permease protein
MAETQIDSGNKVPSSMAQVRITMKYTFLEYIRSRRFYILLALTVIIGLLLTVVALYRPQFFPSTELGFFSAWWGISAPFVVVLSAIFVGGDAISGEFQNKTGYFGVPNPIRRSSIYVGKYFAALVASTIMLVVFTVIAIANGVHFASGVPYQFGESLLFTWFYLVAALGFTFFFSSLFKSSSVSILVSAILLLVVFSLIDTIIVRFVQIEPWFLINYGSQIIGNVLTSPYPTHQAMVTTPGFRPGQTVTYNTFNATIPEGLAIMGIYFIVTSVLGLLLFERKEFN